MALIQLIYVSSAVEELDDAELDRILLSARQHNAELDVTGMLLYQQGSFMQVLEGEAAAVDAIYQRIGQDRRHYGLILLTREPVAERSFPEWRMGFRRLTSRDAASQPGYAPLFLRGFDARQLGIQPGQALDVLKAFCRG